MSNKLTKLIIIAIVAVIVLALTISLATNFAYFMEEVSEEEVGVKFKGGRITEVVPAGLWSDTGFKVDLVKISRKAIPFSVTDEEIITKDKQIVGLVVSGDIFRPSDSDTITKGWARWKLIYTNDEAAQARASDMTRQAMKVCVGDRLFYENVAGTARDELRSCIDEQLNQLITNVGGLEVQNVVVPEIIISPAVKAGLDAIVQSRLETEKAAQDEKKAVALAESELARQQGEIIVEQGRVQEKARQDAQLADLERMKVEAEKAVIEAKAANEQARIAAQRAVIEADKGNELFKVEQDMEIAERTQEVEEIKTQIAVLKAQQTLAKLSERASIYTNNPVLATLEIMLQKWESLKATDKVFLPASADINMLLGPDGFIEGATPLINMSNTNTPDNPAATPN